MRRHLCEILACRSYKTFQESASGHRVTFRAFQPQRRSENLNQARWVGIVSFKALLILNIVSNLGDPSGLSALYKHCFERPVSFASWTIPLAFAISPSALLTSDPSPRSSSTQALKKASGLFSVLIRFLDVKFFAKLRSHALYSSSKFLVETFSESLNERRLSWLNSAASYAATDSSCWVLHCINRWIWDLKLSNELMGFSS